MEFWLAIRGIRGTNSLQIDRADLYGISFANLAAAFMPPYNPWPDYFALEQEVNC
jgi:hypothetical protein